MPDPLTITAKSDFVCDCDESMRSACAEEPFYKEHEGKRYCVLHFPGKEKSADFATALQRKLDNKDFNFPGVWFPDPQSFLKFDFDGEVNFYFATFNAEPDFSDATFSSKVSFSGATFRTEAYFGGATFSAEADFSGTTFNAWADFSGTNFNATADFFRATFSAQVYFFDATFNATAYFSGAIFSAQVYFTRTGFSAPAYFNQSTFKDYVKFAGNEQRAMFGGTSSLDLESARIEKPDCVSFHTLSLRPHWFVNIDARKFEFVNVNWDWRSITKEIADLKKKDVTSPHSLLAIACHQLAVNAEENQRYEHASHFRRMAMDAERRETWRGFGFWKLRWWYWIASGYGERVFQAFAVLAGIWFLSAVFYSGVGSVSGVGFARWEPKVTSESDVATVKRDDVGAPLSFSRALTYSLGVMTLQKPEPRPATPAAQAIVLLETILGPVQAALLALAIRRKFMR